MNFSQNYKIPSTETSHVFAKNRRFCNEALFEEAIDTTPSDWDNLESITPSVEGDAEAVSYEQALAYFKDTDMSEYNDKIIRTVRKSRNVFSCFLNFGKSRLKQEQMDDYNLLFLIAKCPYEKDNKTHIAMLRTVYDSLISKNNLDFSWENIGFQSNLPWTDLRGVGMLGVLQLLYLCQSSPQLKNMLYELSINECNTFPFAVVSLNMTSIVLNVLRHEELNRDVNEEGVFACTNKLYVAIFYHFGQVWINKNMTISDIGTFMKGDKKVILDSQCGVLILNSSKLDVEQSCLSKKTRKKILKILEYELDTGNG